MAGRRATPARAQVLAQTPKVADPQVQHALDVVQAAILELQSRRLLDVFDEDSPGYAPASGGEEFDFLAADGTWKSVVGSGAVDSVTSGSPELTVSPTTGDVVLTLDLSGYAPISHTHPQSDIDSLVADLAARPTGTGTAGKVPKWTGASTLGDSIITDNGLNIEISGGLNVGGAVDVLDTLTVGGLLTASDSVAVSGDLLVQGDTEIDGTLTLPLMTPGSVLFAGTGGVVSQDNAGLYYDDANTQLTIGTAGLSKGLFSSLTRLEVASNGATAMAVSAYSNTAGDKPVLGLYRARGTSGSSLAVQSGDNLGRVQWNGNRTGGDSVFAAAWIDAEATQLWGGSAGGSRVELVTTTNSTLDRLARLGVENDGGITLTNSATAAVSAASELRLRYNTTGHVLQVSANAGAYATVNTGTGTANTLPKWSGTTGTLANSLVTDNGTTVTVAAALSVTGNTAIGNAAGDAHSLTGTLNLNSTAGSNGQIAQIVGGVPTWGAPSAASIPTGTGTVGTVPVFTSATTLGDGQITDSGGIIGLGTVATIVQLLGTLDVNGAASFDSTIALNGTAGSNGQIAQIVGGVPKWDAPSTASIPTGTGNVFAVAYWTGTNTIDASGVTADASGNMGANTLALNSTLTVTGATTLSSTLTLTSETAALSVGGTSLPLLLGGNWGGVDGDTYLATNGNIVIGLNGVEYARFNNGVGLDVAVNTTISGNLAVTGTITENGAAVLSGTIAANAIPKGSGGNLVDSSITDDGAGVVRQAKVTYANLNIGDSVAATTDTQSGFRIFAFNDGNNYLDSKSYAGGLTYFRVGAGAETGGARNWLVVANATGAATFAQSVAVTGNLTVSGNATLNGNNTLGNATTDQHTVNGWLKIVDTVGATLPTSGGWGLITSDDSAQAAGTGGAIMFQGKYTNTGVYTEGAAIKLMKTNATDGNFSFDLVFGTRANAGNITERLRIADTGNVTIQQKLTVGTDLQVDGNSAIGNAVGDSHTVTSQLIVQGTDMGSIFNWTGSANQDTYIRAGVTAGAVHIGDANTGGVNIGAAGNATTVLGTLAANGNVTLGNASADSHVANGDLSVTGSLAVQGNATLGDSDSDSVTVVGDAYLYGSVRSVTEFVAPQITANQNNYDPTDGVAWSVSHASILLVNADASRDITGLAVPAGDDGIHVWLYNTGSFTITLKHQSVSSSAGNRFHGTNNVDVTLRAKEGVHLYYSVTMADWIVLA